MVEVSRSKWHNADKIDNLRRILPQVIATFIGNVHLIDLGLAMAMPSIIIPALMGISNQSNQNETLSIVGEQATWISSIGCIVQVVGSLMAGFLCDVLGRKKLLILANIPFFVGWLLLYRANSVWNVYISLIILGVSNGLVENTVYTYLGETCTPSVRGVLTTFSNMSSSIGIFIAYNLNAWLPWRSIALVCLSAPVLSAVLLICFVPETPAWLLSKKRTKHAEDSLRFLRGWTTKQAVAHEFYELKRHSERSKSCNECMKQDLQCSHPPPTFGEKCTELKRKRTLKPFIIILCLFFVGQFVGVWSMRPFAVQIFKAYESPISTDDTMVILGFLDNVAYIVFMCLLRFTGRRKIYLTMISGVFLSTLVISCYGFIYLPKGITSFGQQNSSFHLENPNLAYIPLICIYIWNFCTLCAVSGMPMMLISELFSFKCRALATGVVASINYIMAFISKKTYYNLEMLLSLPGTSLFFCVISGLGLIFAYFILPETEGRTLEDIELHFSNNSKGLTDRKIAKSPEDATKNQSNPFLNEKF